MAHGPALGKRGPPQQKGAVHSLPVFLRIAERPVILLGQGPSAEAKRRLLERAGARVVGKEEEPAALAIVALEDGGEAEAAVGRLRARGVLVNAVDRPELCDWTLPAIVDRSPLLVAVGTGGASAGLAAALRQRLETLLPANLGRLADALFAARAELRARYPQGDDRRRALDAALRPGGALDPLGGADGDAVARWLSSDGEEAGGAEFAHIRLRSRDPDDLSLREARLLARADRVVHTPDVPAAVLARARADAERIAGTTAPAGDGITILLTMETRV